MTDFLTSLDKALRTNLGCWTNGFNLVDLIVIAAEDQATASWLDRLEAEGYLPPTVSWFNRYGLKVRLYKCPNELGTFDLAHGYINLVIENHPQDVEYVPEPKERLEDFHRSGGDQSMLEVQVAELPEKTREVLRFLQVMGV